MRKFTGLTVLLLLSVSLTFAQTKEIKGKVTDSKDGGPVIGATVTVGTKAYGVTSATGVFTVKVPVATTKITFSSVGYSDTAIAVGSGFLTVLIRPDESKALSEVVITGYTTTQKKKFAGATALVSPEEIRKQPFGSFDQALQGGAAGVSAVAGSGQPGANAVVRIRGNGSINGGNVPLYIMEGIEISAADFASLNQGDFERVEILKDAVATAQYGSRGANGVVVITTRKGKAGKLELTYDGQVGFSKLPEDRLVVMNSDQKITYEMQRGNPYGWTTAQADSLRKVNFNWTDALFQTGVTQQHMISASAGSANSKFYASLSYMNQDGIVKTTGLKRYTARVNVENSVKNFKFGLNLQGGFSNIVATSEGNTTLSTPLNAIRWGNPYERDINPNTGDYQQFGGPGYLYSGQPNAAMELYLDYNYSKQIKAVGNVYLEYHFPFLKGMYFRTNWGIDYANVDAASFNDPRTAGAQARMGALGRSSATSFRYTGTTSLNYKQNFGKHELEVGVFTEAVKNQSSSFGYTAYGFTNGFRNEAGITQGSTANASYIPSVSGGGTENGILSYFGILNYGYSGKYYLTLVGRRDGSSRFGVNNRFANFGSAGITWSVKDEGFMQNIKFVDDLRLRASIGSNGNNQTQAGDYPIPLFGVASYAGVAGWVPATPGNLDYRWETNRTVNLGLDFALLKRRVRGTVEFYERKTMDLYASNFIDPQNSGFSSVPSNYGTLMNRGVEITLGGDVISSKNFNWNITGNITYNQNKVIDLIQDSVVGGTTILKEGYASNTLFLVEYGGVNPANGNALYVNPATKATTMTYSTALKTYYGTTDAPWFGGITSTWRYKGFELSAQLNFFLNRVQYNNDKNNLTNPTYYFDNMHVEVLKEWKAPGDITNVPRPSSGATSLGPANPYQSATTRFLEDASFWRLRNVTFGYTFSSKLLSKAKIRTARIFVQGQNLWTATQFQSFDPETTGTSLTGAQYPALKQTTIGLTVGF
jgi:TonB-linked SusC/RagA family outer membrane protein